MPLFPYKLVDLTHTITPQSPTWEGGCGFQHTNNIDYQDCTGDVKFRVQSIDMLAGVGTHIDAPAHCIEQGDTVDQLPVSKLVAPMVCIDVSHKMSPNQLVAMEDICTFEEEHAPIKEDLFIIFHTGWSKFWSDGKKYRNQQQFPSVSSEVAEYLVEKRIRGLGIDTFSPDVPASGFPVHKTILGAGKYIVENIANANLLPPTGAYVMTLPIKAAGLTEAPVRMIGMMVS